MGELFMARKKPKSSISPQRKDARKALGFYLRAHREKAGLSQINIAIRMKYDSAQFISNIERGLCAIPLNLIAIYVDACKINKEEILNFMMKSTEHEIRAALKMPAPKRKTA